MTSRNPSLAQAKKCIEAWMHKTSCPIEVNFLNFKKEIISLQCLKSFYISVGQPRLFPKSDQAGANSIKKILNSTKIWFAIKRSVQGAS